MVSLVFGSRGMDLWVDSMWLRTWLIPIELTIDVLDSRELFFFLFHHLSIRPLLVVTAMYIHELFAASTEAKI